MKEGFRNIWQLIDSHAYTRIVSLVALFLIIAAIPLTVFLSQQRQEIRQRATEPTPLSFPSLNASLSDKVIIKVGKENIYQKDFNYELSSYPTTITENENRIIVDKLIQDSIILQGARDEGLIGVDNTTFNSLDKDYSKRLELIKQAKDTVENKAESISGAVVSIWFVTGPEKKPTYDQDKQLAFEKITKLHQAVKDRKMTMKRAADQVRSDTSLEKLDPAYKNNASFNFNVHRNGKITFDEAFNQALWSLNEGDISDVFLAKDKLADGREIEAMYHFGKVTKKAINDQIKSFEEWLAKKKNTYAVTYY